MGSVLVGLTTSQVCKLTRWLKNVGELYQSRNTFSSYPISVSLIIKKHMMKLMAPFHILWLHQWRYLSRSMTFRQTSVPKFIGQTTEVWISKRIFCVFVYNLNTSHWIHLSLHLKGRFGNSYLDICVTRK